MLHPVRPLPRGRGRGVGHCAGQPSVAGGQVFVVPVACGGQVLVVVVVAQFVVLTVVFVALSVEIVAPGGNTTTDPAGT